MSTLFGESEKRYRSSLESIVEIVPAKKQKSSIFTEENVGDSKKEIVPGFAKNMREKVIELTHFLENRKNEEESKIMVAATEVSPDQANSLFLEDGTEEAALIKSHRVFYDAATKELKFFQLPSGRHEVIGMWVTDCFAEGYGQRFYRNCFQRMSSTAYTLGDGGKKQADYSHLPRGSALNPGWMNGGYRGPSFVIEVARSQGWREADAEIQRWFAPQIVGGVANNSDVNITLMFYISERDVTGNWFGIAVLKDRQSGGFPNADQLVSFGTRVVPADPAHPLNLFTDVAGNMQARFGIPVASNAAVCNGANQSVLVINSASLWFPNNVPVGIPNVLQFDLYSLQLEIESVP